jgi:hypothetical protein
MASFIQRHPWGSIFRAAALSTLVGAFANSLLFAFHRNTAVGETALNFLRQHPLGIVTDIGIGYLLGALGVVLLDRNEKGIGIYISTLWFLVLALIVGLLTYDLFPIRPYRLWFTLFNRLTLVGLVLGVFWTGKKFWR